HALTVPLCTRHAFANAAFAFFVAGTARGSISVRPSGCAVAASFVCDVVDQLARVTISALIPVFFSSCSEPAGSCCGHPTCTAQSGFHVCVACGGRDEWVRLPFWLLVWRRCVVLIGYA